MDTSGELEDRECYIIKVTDLINMVRYRFDDEDGPLMRVVEDFVSNLQKILEPDGWHVSCASRDLEEWLVISGPYPFGTRSVRDPWPDQTPGGDSVCQIKPN